MPYSLEIINHENSFLSEKRLLQEEDSIGKIIEQYFNQHKITVLDYLRNILSINAIDIDSQEVYKVEVFHILFDPILVKVNDDDRRNPDKDRGRPDEVDPSTEH